MFMFGKTLKYTCWAGFAVFLYHMYIVKSYDKPEKAPLAFEPFLGAAKFVDWSIYDLRLLFTQPGMSKMLPDRFEFPGQQAPKTLVLNLQGTLVH